MHDSGFWKHIDKLVSKFGDPAGAGALLHSRAPHTIPWPHAPGELARLRDRFGRILPNLDLSMAAGLLVTVNEGLPEPAAAWLRDDLLPSCGLDGIGDALAGAFWVISPLPLTINGEGGLRHLAVARLGRDSERCFPEWTGRVLSSKSLRAAELALAAARRDRPGRDAGRRLFFFPVIAPNDPDIAEVDGESLGLPLLLGLMAAARNTTIPANTCATGALDPDDPAAPLRKVDGLREKADKALECGFSRMIVPAANSGLPDTRLAIIPAKDPVHAWIITSCPGTGNGEEDNRLHTALQSARDFATNIGNLSPEQVEWIIAERRHLDLLEETGGDADLAMAIANALRTIDDRSRRDERAKELVRVMASLLPDPESAARALGKSEQALFVWAARCLAMANHAGDRGAAAQWTALARDLQDKVLPLEREEVPRFINRCMVNERHNRYDFQAQLPPWFENTLKEAERYTNPRVLDYPLASMYGTVCQNHAFCHDPDGAEEYARKALEIFERGGRDNDIRMINTYRAFALLDAGRFDQARERLRDCGIASPGDIPGLFDTGKAPFSCHLAARLLADLIEAGKAPPEYHGIAKETTGRNLATAESMTGLERHPWQLVAHNTGRLAAACGRKEQAEALWRWSALACRKIGQATTRVMAWLPFSRLWQEGMLTGDDRDQVMEILAWLRGTDLLERSHFAPVLQATSADGLLETIASDPSVLFPFNYR